MNFHQISGLGTPRFAAQKRGHRSNFAVTGGTSVAKVVGATSSDDFLVLKMRPAAIRSDICDDRSRRSCIELYSPFFFFFSSRWSRCGRLMAAVAGAYKGVNYGSATWRRFLAFSQKSLLRSERIVGTPASRPSILITGAASQ